MVSGPLGGAITASSSGGARASPRAGSPVAVSGRRQRSHKGRLSVWKFGLLPGPLWSRGTERTRKHQGAQRHWPPARPGTPHQAPNCLALSSSRRPSPALHAAAAWPDPPCLSAPGAHPSCSCPARNRRLVPHAPATPPPVPSSPRPTAAPTTHPHRTKAHPPALPPSRPPTPAHPLPPRSSVQPAARRAPLERCKAPLHLLGHVVLLLLLVPPPLAAARPAARRAPAAAAAAAAPVPPLRPRRAVLLGLLARVVLQRRVPPDRPAESARRGARRVGA
jgi:hypothetical protein